MTPRAFADELDFLTCKAIEAIGVIPRKSFYLAWAKQLVAGTLPASRYPRLRRRLMEFYEKNN